MRFKFDTHQNKDVKHIMPDFPEWVILAYLDGNNELEPETTAALREMRYLPWGHNTILLVQIGRLSQNAVKILRPEIRSGHPEKDRWSGVRRYRIGKAGTVLEKELGNLNMADPWNLFHFILWGMKKFKASHYMLILSGHSCEYIGMLNDYSQPKPYLMGIPELSLVLESIYKTTGRPIDALLLDTCLFNNIEVLYELAQGGAAVRTALMHRSSAPAAGLSYRELFQAMDECGPAQDAQALLKRLVQFSSADLIAYRMDPFRLEQIKKRFSSLACLYLDPKDRDLFSLFRSRDQTFPGWEIRDELVRLTSSLIIGQKSAFRQPAEAICVLDQYIPDKNTAELYYRLAFARENAWTRLLCSRLPEKQFQFIVSVGFSPLPLGKNKVKALIGSCNTARSETQISEILDALASERGWDF